MSIPESDYEPVGIHKTTDLPAPRLLNALRALFAPKSETYTKLESDSTFATKAETYTETESDARFEAKGTGYSKARADELLAEKANKSEVVSVPTVNAIARANDFDLVRDVGVFNVLQDGIINQLQDTRVAVIGNTVPQAFNSYPTSAGVFQRLAYMSGSRTIGALYNIATAVQPAGMQWFQGEAEMSSELGANVRLTAIERLRPGYIIIAVGGADWAAGTSLAQYEANVRGAVEAYEQRSPNVVVTLVHMQGRLDGPKPIPYSGYGDVLAKIAADKPTRAFVNVDSALRKLGFVDRNRAGMIEPNLIHLRGIGQKLVSDIIGSVMGVPSPSKIATGKDVFQFQRPADSATYQSGSIVGNIEIPPASYTRILTLSGSLYVGEAEEISWSIKRDDEGLRYITHTIASQARQTVNMTGIVILEPYSKYQIGYGPTGGDAYVTHVPSFHNLYASVEAM